MSINKIEIKKDPMLDPDFLLALDEQHLREIYAKVIAIDMNENPLFEVTGIVQSGSISVDSKSSVRRTCSISMTTVEPQTKLNIEWALRTKFKLYIGLKNFIDPTYDDIIYFKMGTFVLTSYNASFNATGYTISIQGRDKMCLLNGDVGGALAAETDFGARWDQIAGTNRYDKYEIPIKTIIREAVHQYAQEPYSNIIINDLNTCGVELLAYRAHNNPIYVYEITVNDTIIHQMCFEDSVLGRAFRDGQDIRQIDHDGKPITVYRTEGNNKIYQGDGLTIKFQSRNYKIIKRADYGETIGFRATDLTYVGDLIAKVGESITSIFDKIVKMLGDFEYFYDTDGHFIFQRKKTYYNTQWSNAKVSSEDNGYTGTEYYYDSTVNTSAEAYSFYGGNLIESYTNSPKLTNIKNDFSLWGSVKGIKINIPIHLRCAIDVKPEHYESKFATFLKHTLTQAEKDYIATVQSKYKTMQYHTLIEDYDTHIMQNNIQYVDWRELIYQMASDSLNMRGLMEDITADLNNPSHVYGPDKYEMITGILSRLEALYDENLDLGYSFYYEDILGFWRDLYRTTREPHIVYKYKENGDIETDDDGNQVEDEDQTFTVNEFKRWVSNGYWNPDCFRYDQNKNEVTVYDPSIVRFWFDFLDPYSGLQPYSIPVIGRRPKVVNDDKIKSIFVRDTPNVLFVDPNEDLVQYEKDLHYVRLNIPSAYANYFSMSGQGKSAKEELDSIIYESTYFQDTISISAIPVYYLEPNTRIKVYDETTGIDGDYLINSLSYSIAHDGMMTIQATKAEQRIL